MFKISKKTKRNSNSFSFAVKTFLAPIIQLIVSVVFVALVITGGLLPTQYILIIIIAMLIALLGTVISQCSQRKFIQIMGIVFTVIVCIVSAFGIYTLVTARQVIVDISGATYKTSTMAVVVRVDDPAEDIFDSADYSFANQNTIDVENNELMIADVEEVLEQSINLTTYSDIISLGTALINGDVDAIIYNEAFLPLVEENIDGYSDMVKTIYYYHIEVEIESEVSENENGESSIEDIVDIFSISQDPFNVYLSGIDVSGSINITSRSDVNIILSVNPSTKEILIINTPRDYYVQFPDVTGSSYDKLTHAGIYGIDVSVSTLENLYGIEIDYYAKVNFTSVINIVDALGGIEVYSDYTFDYNNEFYYTSGYNYLYGEAALGFCRERSSFASGDNQRGINQQQVIIGIINKMMSPSILSNFTTLIESISGSVQTSMTDSEITELVNMQLTDAASWNIETVSATGTNGSDYCYSSGSSKKYSIIYPDYDVVESISEQIAALFAGE